MSDSAVQTETITAEPEKSRARVALLKRLADVVSLPSSRVNAFERSVTADLLVEILREADPEDKVRVARRVAGLTDVPGPLVRLLLRDDIEVAGPLLEGNPSLGECDLLDCVATAGEEHRRTIAGRRNLSDAVSDALIGKGEIPVIEVLLRNEGARLSHSGVDTLVAMSRTAPILTPALLRRPELRPSHAYAMFWWADASARRTVLQRFAVSREVLQDAVSDVFAMASAESWRDDLSRKALQFIERRQRNRAAIQRSPYASLEEAVEGAEREMTSETLTEIAHLSGVKPMIAAKIMADPGGEPVAILCKATGLPKSALTSLWRAMKRADVGPDGEIAPQLEHVIITFDMIAVDRAQTVLRYWNWSLAAAAGPALLEAMRESAIAPGDEASAAPPVAEVA